ncbi:hypothetical protein GGI23_005916 [Coemansia sp. RSA 2559]|nr:hypothetical protein GGI23_005916 [Coemansia sp. RSA 2559]
MIGENEVCAADPTQQLTSSTIIQYDSVVRARPIADVCQITLISNPVAILPQQQAAPASPPVSASAEKQAHSDTANEILGCTGSSWHAMVHIKFATTSSSGNQEDAELNGWSIWFATKASAQECVEALDSLSKSAGVVDVEICET